MRPLASTYHYEPVFAYRYHAALSAAQQSCWYGNYSEGRTKAMTNFAETAMLVALNVRCYGAKREDKRVSKDVAVRNGADDDAGKYAKNLVPKSSLEPVVKAISALRSFHYNNTLPWCDDGVRCLPAMNYEAYKTEIEGLKDQYESAVAAFVREWPTLIQDAPKKLGTLYNAADYPADVRGRFGVHIRFMPVADASDFRVQMSDLERSQLQEEITATLHEAQTAATADLYRRLMECTKAMAERLAVYRKDDATGKTSNPFRDSLVENLRDVCALIPRLNFSGDARLESMRAEVERELCQWSAAELRENDAARASVARSADGIAARLGEFMGTPG